MATASSPRLSCLLGCSTSTTASEAAACSLLQAASCTLGSTASPQQRRWYSVLAELQSTEEPSASPEKDVEFVARLLREALQCVQGDEQWNCSGIAQMLQRALEMSERGCIQSARKAAVGLLDFHKMVEKYRQVVASRTKSSGSGHSTGSGKRQCSDDMDSDFSEDACGPLKRQRTTGLEESNAADENHSDQRPSEFAVPHLPAKKAPHPAPINHVVAPPSASAASTSVVWTGSIWQNVPNGRDLIYCKISVPLPAECTKELAESQNLEVVQLAPRRGVKLGRHRVCKCTIVEASVAQLAKLKSMAQNELVALAPLESHGLILVPYLDNAGNVRLVCFCLVL
ncbi:Charged multivesicular body protein 4C [Pleodorina starrii]|uniref:Charged multivesicular body protein 4C n=1 Tax=Pleodorina starrii TaxID=330485 RepID=A0A9W6F5U5_9CHLO|nr:Charged multivesicular body protein 4C [Pleodorina starrii]GLC57374.1 Charged multivesicular body protein 4C [Pleodorina starrii]